MNKNLNQKIEELRKENERLKEIIKTFPKGRFLSSKKRIRKKIRENNKIITDLTIKLYPEKELTRKSIFLGHPIDYILTEAVLSVVATNPDEEVRIKLSKNLKEFTAKNSILTITATKKKDKDIERWDYEVKIKAKNLLKLKEMM